MPVPSAWGDISDTATSNSPQSSETVGPNMSAYFQAAFAYIKQLYEGQMAPTAAPNFNAQKLSNIANGTAATDAVAFGQLAAYAPLAGATFAGPCAFNGSATFNGVTNFSQPVTMTNGGQTLTIASGNNGAISLLSGGNLKLVSVEGYVKFLRCATGGLFQIVNQSYNGTPMSMDDVGNVTFTGNVGAYSDERLKTDWHAMDENFVDQLSTLKAGRYKRKDSGEAQVGVSAQELQKILPDAVRVEHDGYLSVAYGQAALVACVELAKELARLRARVEELEGV